MQLTSGADKGLIYANAGRSYSVPYFSNIAAGGLAVATLATGDMRYVNAAWDWLDWYAAHMDSNGFITNYIPMGGRWVSNGQMDSTDGYAGTFLTAVRDAWVASGNSARLDALWPAVRKGVAAMLATDNGKWLTYAKPGYPHAFIMDNVEVYEGFRAVEYLAGSVHPDPEMRHIAGLWTANMPAAFETYWNESRAGYDIAIGFDGSRYAVDWATLYPAAAAQSWMTRTGLVPPARAQTIMQHVDDAMPAWDRSGEAAGSFWWPEIIEGMRAAGLTARARGGLANMSSSVIAGGRAWPYHVGNSGTIIKMIAGEPQTYLNASPAAFVKPGAASFAFFGLPAMATGGSATFECRIDGGVFVPCGAQWTTGALSEGAHWIEVAAVDSTTARDPTPARLDWIVDATPPLARIVESPAEPGNASPRFAFDAIDAAPSNLISFECSIDFAAFAPCASPGSFALSSTGTHSFRIRGTDPAGNSGLEASHSWYADGVRPETSIVAPPPPNVTDGNVSIAFGGSDDAGVAGFECKLGAGAWSGCVSPFAASLDEGAWTFGVRAVDGAGNADASPAQVSWRVDRTAPATVLVESPPAYSQATSARFVFSGSDSIPGSLFYECSIDGLAFVRCVSPRTYSGLSPGAHTFAVRAVDASGIADPTPASSAWVVDPSTPTGSVGTPDGAILADLPPVARRVLSGEAFDSVSGVAGVSVRFAPMTTLGDLLLAPAELACAGAGRRVCTWTAAAPREPGRYRTTIRIADFAGNLSVFAGPSVYVV